MVKKSLERCDATPHFTVEKTEAKECAGFWEEHSELLAALLLL